MYCSRYTTTCSCVCFCGHRRNSDRAILGERRAPNPESGRMTIKSFVFRIVPIHEDETRSYPIVTDFQEHEHSHSLHDGI